MLTLDVSPAIRTLSEYFSGTVLKQLPFATMKALNDTAQKVKEREQHEIRDVFNRPTPITVDSVAVEWATKQRQSVRIYIKNFAGKQVPASKYLAAEVSGGIRRLKRFERALRAAGVLPDGMYAVPGSGAKLDSYGNMSGAQIVQILSYFKAFPQLGYRANMTDRRRKSLEKGNAKKNIQGFAYFVGRPGDRLPLGVWQRFTFASGSSIRPILLFVNSATYEAIFDFAFVAQTVAERELPKAFNARLEEALRTAR